MTSSRQHRAWASIDLAALRHNLSLARARSGGAQVTAVIKSNAYGHGMEQVAEALSDGESRADRFAVATMDEAVALNLLGTGVPILHLQGFQDRDELAYLAEAGIEMVVHADYQLALLRRFLDDNPGRRRLNLWLKLNTGMNRLGLEPADFAAAFQSLHGHPEIASIVVMSHLASADAPQDRQASLRTREQMSQFRKCCDALDIAEDQSLNRSLAASAGILAWPDTHFEQVRPGIMLYGGSPFGDRHGPGFDLKPVMTLQSRLMATRQVPAGAAIGYGGTHVCREPTLIGVASIGYGDGYPRLAVSGTPVLVNSGGEKQRCRLLGRVSMDMITIDLNDCPDAVPGDEVVLWGEDLPADEVAEFAGTISYELFCRVTKRVQFVYG